MTPSDEKRDTAVAAQVLADRTEVVAVDQAPASIEPTDDDLRKLCRVADKIPSAVWTVASFSGLERFAFYAVQCPLRKCHTHFRQGKLTLESLQKITFRISLQILGVRLR
jgi:hypothetical protein